MPAAEPATTRAPERPPSTRSQPSFRLSAKAAQALVVTELLLLRSALLAATLLEGLLWLLLRQLLRLLGAFHRSPPVCAITSPAVILGVFGSADSSFCSRIHRAATRVDSWACSAVLNRPTEVRTPSLASIR